MGEVTNNNQLVTGASKVGSGWQESINNHTTTTVGDDKQRERVADVCVFLASGYGWVTVMHEILISSAQPLTSLPYPRTW